MLSGRVEKMLFCREVIRSISRVGRPREPLGGEDERRTATPTFTLGIRFSPVALLTGNCSLSDHADTTLPNASPAAKFMSFCWLAAPGLV